SFLNFALFLKGGIARPKQQQPVTHTISEIIQFDRWLKRRLHCASADGEWVHQRYTENGRANFLRCSRLDWWSRWDSNPRPPRCHRGALPTAPQPHRGGYEFYHTPRVRGSIVNSPPCEPDISSSSISVRGGVVQSLAVHRTGIGEESRDHRPDRDALEAEAQVAARRIHGDDGSADGGGEFLGRMRIDHVVLRRNEDEHPGVHLLCGQRQSYAEFGGNVQIDDGLPLANAIGRRAAVFLRVLAHFGQKNVKFARLRMRDLIVGRRTVHFFDQVSENETRVERAGWSAVMPRRVKFNRADGAGPEQLVLERGLRRAYDGDGQIHKIRVPHGPLKCLHSAHGNAHHRVQVRDPQNFCGKAVFGLHHVADGNSREFQERLGFAVRG